VPCGQQKNKSRKGQEREGEAVYVCFIFSKVLKGWVTMVQNSSHLLYKLLRGGHIKKTGKIVPFHEYANANIVGKKHTYREKRET